MSEMRIFDSETVLPDLIELKQSLLQKAFSGELTANRKRAEKTLKEEELL